MLLAYIRGKKFRIFDRKIPKIRKNVKVNCKNIVWKTSKDSQTSKDLDGIKNRTVKYGQICHASSKCAPF